MVDGLKYVPKYKDMDQQTLPTEFMKIAQLIKKEDYYSFKNRMVLMNCMKKLGLDVSTDAHKLILEIGLGNESRLVNTSTFALIGFKASTTKYFGIDRQSRDFWKRELQNINIIENTAENIFKGWVWDIDLLHIDGGHSVNDTLIDWQFVEFVKPYGIIVLHDIKAHPGPKELVKAIDRDIYTVHELFLNDPKDFGMAVVYKKENDYDAVCS